jgi:hypothetical protein
MAHLTFFAFFEGWWGWHPTSRKKILFYINLFSNAKKGSTCFIIILVIITMHTIWQKVRRPFVYPRCVKECQWDIYDANSAGCLKCGRQHYCTKHVFEGNCPLIQNDDGSRVCTITGWVVPEVRYSSDEYLDHVQFTHTNHNHQCGGGGASHHGSGSAHSNIDFQTEIQKIMDKLLLSDIAIQCRNTENKLQIKKIIKSFIKSIRVFKLKSPHKLPNICDLLTHTMHQEKKLMFIYPISTPLYQRCHQAIFQCILQLKKKGFKVYIGNKLQDLVCGLLYLLRTGISYNNHEFLQAIPEISRCLLLESRLKLYFGVNSKVITSIENEVKLAFRDYYQK